MKGERVTTHQKFKVGDIVWYGSLGDAVQFKIINRCIDGRRVLEVVESACQYDGGWPIGRLMLADKFMLRLIEPPRQRERSSNMIEGIKLDFSTDELAEHFSKRINHHDERITFYETQARALREGGAERAEYTGGDPVEALQRSEQSHRSRRELLTVIRDHLIGGETYRLTETDLVKIELIDRAY